ncbi:MAG: hypothetical protein ACK6D1_19055 [Planctomycetota bacterium]
MTTPRPLAVLLSRLLLASLAAAPVRAQDGASTLAANLDAADAVVVANVAEHAVSPEGLLRVRMVVAATLTAGAPAAFPLVEPAGACCGRSLFALQPGDTRLAFLRRQGATWHVFGGPRGLLPSTDAIVAHVRRLATHRSGPARTTVLLEALTAAEPRIADYAAWALAGQPDLALDAAGRARVGESLDRELARRSARAAPLLEITARVADAGLRDALLARYLASPHDDEAALLANSLLRTPVAGTVELAMAGARDERSGLRAAALAAGLETDAAIAACFRMLPRAPSPRVQLRLCEELLDRGVPAAQLRAAPAPIVETAQKRVAARSAVRTTKETR